MPLLRNQSENILSYHLKKSGVELMLASLQPDVYQMLVRGGLEEKIGQENIFWSADQAIVEAEKRGCAYCGV